MGHENSIDGTAVSIGLAQRQWFDYILALKTVVLTRNYAMVSCLSGAVWGGIVTLIASEFSPTTLGGLIASPMIGLLIGMATRNWSDLKPALRIAAALLSLYVAAALFGLGVGIYDWLIINTPDRIAWAVVVQGILAFLWGLTFTGYFIALWPLAYLNHWLLGCVNAAGQSNAPEDSTSDATH